LEGILKRIVVHSICRGPSSPMWNTDNKNDERLNFSKQKCSLAIVLVMSYQMSWFPRM
jgi:hypothetical protein